MFPHKMKTEFECIFKKKNLKFNTLQDYHVCSLSNCHLSSINLCISSFLTWDVPLLYEVLILASTWFTFLYLQNFPWKHKYASIIYCFARKYFRYIKFIFWVMYKVDEYTHIYLEIGKKIGFFCRHLEQFWWKSILLKNVQWAQNKV